jgi:hypothetical protein
MVNRYTQFTPLEFNLDKPDVKVAAVALEHLQKKFDVNLEAADKMKDLLIDALPHDRLRANELQKGIAKRVDDVVASYNGDYSQATKSLYDLKSQIRKEFAPGGEAAEIAQNYKNYGEWRTRQEERIKKGDVSSDDFAAANKYYMENFKGTVADPTTGLFNRFEADEVAKRIDPDQIIQDVYKNFKPEKIKTATTVFKNGLKTDITVETEGITSERLLPSFEVALQNNPDFAAHIMQRAKFAGVDPETVKTYVANYAKQRAHDLSYMSKTNMSLSDRDQLALLNAREDREDARKKAELDALYGGFQALPTAGSIYNDIDASRLRSQVGTGDASSWLAKTGEFVGNTVSKAMGPLGSLIPVGTVGKDLYNSNNGVASNRDRKANLISLSEDKEYMSKNRINGNLLESNIEESQRMLAPDAEDARRIFDKNYGKNAEWTKNFDKQVMDMYSKDIKDNSLTEPYMIPIYGKAGEEMMSRTYSALSTRPEDLRVMELGGSEYLRPSEIGLTAEDLLTSSPTSEKGTKLSTDVNYIPAQANVPTGGLVISKNGKTYVIEDQDEERRTLNRNIGKSFQEIHQGNNRRSSTPIELGQNANGIVYGVPQINYTRDADGRKRSYTNYVILDQRTGEPAIDEKTGTEITYRPESKLDIYKNYKSYEHIVSKKTTKKE